MTIHYNRHSVKYLRQNFRNNATTAEQTLWKYIRKNQLSGIKFRRQYSVDKFIIDFYCTELKLAIELDGSIHNTTEVKYNDEIRQKYLERFGIKFIRIKNDDVFLNPEEVFKIILEEIRQRKKHLEGKSQRVK